MARRGRRLKVFTCDRGTRTLHVDRDPPRLVASILQEVVESGFWRQLVRFPPDVVSRHVGDLQIPRGTRRLLEIWVEEATKPR